MATQSPKTRRSRPEAAYDELQHAPVSDAPRGLRRKGRETAIEEIVGWFRSNFEEPVHSTPVEGGEYVYIWGGPYDAREILQDVFSGKVPTTWLGEAISELESESFEWVPNEARRLPPEEVFLPEEFAATFSDTPSLAMRPDPRAAHQVVVARIEELEPWMEEARPPPGMGHNNPPQDARLAPLKTADFLKLEVSITVLKKATPERKDNSVVQAASFVRRAGNEIFNFARRYGDIFFSEFCKSSGSELGKTVVKGAKWWGGLYLALKAVEVATDHWLSLIPPF